MGKLCRQFILLDYSTMKQTRIFNILQPKQLSGFLDFPTQYVDTTNDIDYRILKDEKFDAGIVASQIDSGADITIRTLTESDVPSYWDPACKILNINRYPKSTQAVFLNHFMTKVLDEQLEHYKELKTYSGTTAGRLPRSVPEGNYIIKPARGARSLALMFIDTREMHIREFSNLLCRHIRRYDKDMAKLEESGQKHLIINKTACLNEFFEPLREKHGFYWTRGDEFVEDDAASIIFKRDLIVQELNPATDAVEYRALRCLDATPLIYQRQDLADNYIGYSNEYADIPTHLLKEIMLVLRHPKFPGIFGSVDLWVSKEKNQWGIYEFQPEYCARNIRVADHDFFLQMALEAMWNYCYPEMKEVE